MSFALLESLVPYVPGTLTKLAQGMLMNVDDEYLAEEEAWFLTRASAQLDFLERLEAYPPEELVEPLLSQNMREIFALGLMYLDLALVVRRRNGKAKWDALQRERMFIL